VPAGTTTALPVFPNHGKNEPQFLQNDVAKYLVSLGSYLPTNSLPLSQLKSFGDTNIFEANACTPSKFSASRTVAILKYAKIASYFIRYLITETASDSLITGHGNTPVWQMFELTVISFLSIKTLADVHVMILCCIIIFGKFRL